MKTLESNTAAAAEIGKLIELNKNLNGDSLTADFASASPLLVLLLIY